MSPPHRTGVMAAVVALVAALVAGCADSGTDAASPARPTTTAAASPAQPTATEPATTTTTPATGTVPGADWTSVAPADAGLDAAALDEIAATAGAGNSHCLVVVRAGRIAGEWNFGATTVDSTQNVFSVTKSVTSTLVGIAHGDGVLDLDQPASTWITEWRGTPSESVTVRDLLSNDSGREWRVGIDYVQLIQATDKTAFAVGLGQDAPPGEVWAYNNSAIQTLERILEAATDTDVAAYARDRLFVPIGMTHSSLAPDGAGNAQTFQGMRSNCRDLARFGTLMLNGGRWGDEQIVPADWVAEATGRSSTELNQAYGHLWWLNRPGTIVSPLVAAGVGDASTTAPTEGQIAAGAPKDMFWAVGLGNQVVQVDPGSGTVVVRLGPGVPRPTPPTFGPAEASAVVTRAVR